ANGDDGSRGRCEYRTHPGKCLVAGSVGSRRLRESDVLAGRPVMETVHEFLAKLARDGVKLSVETGQLNCYAPKGLLTPEVRDGIARHRTEIIGLLEGREGRAAAKTATEFPLSAGQKGLYILQKLHPGMSAYNVPLCFKIEGAVDAALLARAWDAVLEQYPILTARVVERD